MTKSKNLGDLIDRSRDLERTAVIDLNNAENPRIFSHGKIDRLANGVARHLVRRGFPRGSRVAIVSLNRAEYVAAYFGIMRAGYVAVPVNTKVPRATIDTIMDDAAIVLAFVDDLGLVRKGIPAIDFDDLGGGFAAQIAPAEYTAVEAGPQEI